MPEPRKKKRTRNQAPKPSLNASIGNGSGGPPTSPEDAEVMEAPIPEQPVKTDAPIVQDDRGKVVDEHNRRGVAQLLHDPEFMNLMITEMVANRTLDSVTEEIADKVSDALEESPEFGRRLIDAFMSSEVARGKFLRATIKALA